MHRQARYAMDEGVDIWAGVRHPACQPLANLQAIAAACREGYWGDASMQELNAIREAVIGGSAEMEDRIGEATAAGILPAAVMNGG